MPESSPVPGVEVVELGRESLSPPCAVEVTEVAGVLLHPGALPPSRRPAVLPSAGLLLVLPDGRPSVEKMPA